MVETTRLLLEIDIRKTIKELFYIRDTTELEKMLNIMAVENEGYLTWGEFVELLFRHKRTVKPPEREQIKSKAKHDLIVKPVESANSNEVNAIARNQSHKKSKQKSEETKITIPKPFNFDERDKEKKIKEKILSKVQAKPVEKIHPPFTANPIPLSTLLPKYEMIVAKNEARRMEVKQTSYEVTKTREKPFSFYERDKEKYMRRMNADDSSKIPGKQFKATPIPPHVSVQLYEQMARDREAKREERVKKHAEETLAKSKLPPRMEMDQHKKKAAKKPEEKPSFKPEKVHPLPDFNKQYEEFQRALERHKKERKPTVPEPFKLEETKVYINVIGR